MPIAVDNLPAALAAVGRVQAEFADFRPLWLRLAAAPLPDLMRARWDAAFGLGLRPADSTIEERRERDADTYYGAHAPNPRARADGPYFEWTGALREAASGWTTVEALKATIDPSRNYRGPLGPGGWDETGARFLPDDALYPLRDVEAMVERELEAWAKDVAERAK